jgi:hypothetical protein
VDGFVEVSILSPCPTITYRDFEFKIDLFDFFGRDSGILQRFLGTSKPASAHTTVENHEFSNPFDEGEKK